MAISAAGTSCFLLCYGVAIALYPGGTWFDHQAQGHSFWLNFLCDLMQTRALNGQEAHVGSLLARIGAVAMFVALASFFTQISRLEFPSSRAGRVARRAGVLACALGAAVPILPSDLFRDAHVISVVVAFVPSLVATLAAFRVCLRAPAISRWILALGALTLGAGALDGILYAYAYAQAFGFVPTQHSPLLYHALPVFQRIAILGLVAWTVAMSVHTARSTRSTRSTRSLSSSQR